MSSAELLACVGIGTGAAVVVLGLLKTALDGDGHRAAEACHAEDRYPPLSAPPVLPARARHAAPPVVDETQPIRCVQPRRARHAREAA